MIGGTLADLMVMVGADVSGMVGGFNKGQKAAVEFENSLYRSGRRMADIGRGMTFGLTLPLAAGGAMAIKTAADFQRSMNTMEAVADVPADDLKQLSSLAMQLGQDTIFSTNEAAAAMLELAKGGIEPAQIQAGALATTLDLAAASDMELAESATVLSNAMNTFGLEGKNAVEIADALAGAANSSSADISDMAYAMQAGGSAAARFGMTIQDTSALLALLADRGIKGSDAGTLLKSQLRTLVPVTEKARSKMAELGLDFFDAGGNFIGLSGMAQELQKELSGLTQEQRETAIAQLFGSDASRLAGILAKEGAAGLTEYTEATNDAGAAADVANAKMKGLPGALEMAAGSIETAALAAGQSLAPAITLVAKLVTLATNAFTALPGPLRTVAVAFLVLTAAAGPTLWVIGKYRMALSNLIGPITKVVAATKWYTAVNLAAGKSVSGWRAAMGGMHIELTKNSKMYGRASKLASGLKLATGSTWGAIASGGAILAVSTAAVISWSKALEASGEAARLAAENHESSVGLVEAWGNQLRAGTLDVEEFKAKVEALAPEMQEVHTGFVGWTNRLADWAHGNVSAAEAMDHRNQIMGASKGILEEFASAEKVVVEQNGKLVETTTDAYLATKQFAGMAAKEYETWREKSVPNFNLVMGRLDKLAGKNKLTADVIINSMRRAMRAQIDFGKNWNQVVDRAGKRGESFVAWIQENYGAKAPAMVAALADANKKQFNEIIRIWKNAQQHADTASRKTGESLYKIPKAAQDANGITKTHVGKIPGVVRDQEGPARTAATGVGNAITDGLTVGIRNSAGEVANEAAKTVTDAIQAAKTAADSSSPSRKTMALGLDMAKGLAIGIRRGKGLVDSQMRALGDVSPVMHGSGFEKSAVSAGSDDGAVADSVRPSIEATFVTRGKPDKKFAKDALDELDWVTRTEVFNGS